MIYKIKDKDYTITELKALLKKDNILEECYDEWLKADGNFNEFFDYAVEKRIAIIVDNYKENIRKNGQESRWLGILKDVLTSKTNVVTFVKYGVSPQSPKKIKKEQWKWKMKQENLW